jgi:hypothetical protein
VRAPFVGEWRLVTFLNFDESGKATPAAYDAGRIAYHPNGYMSAHLMRSNRARLGTPPTDAERAASYSGYVAYYGRYVVDPGARSVSHHVEGSLNPNWVDTTLVRYWAFSPDGRRMILSVRNASGRTTGSLTWERLP